VAQPPPPADALPGPGNGIWPKAVAANKLYYIRVTCGMDTATTTATTVPFPFGSTYAPPIQLDPMDDSKVLRPTWPDTRNTRLIDPWSGSEMFRMSTLAESTGGSDLGSGGNPARCSEAQHEDGWFLCINGGYDHPARVNIYAVRPTATGMESRYLGYSPMIDHGAGNFVCPDMSFGFDPNTFGVWYCQAASGYSLVKYTYTGSFVDKTGSAPYVITPDATVAACVVGVTAFLETRFKGNSIPSST